MFCMDTTRMYRNCRIFRLHISVLILLFVKNVCSNTATCERDMAISYLDIAVDMMVKARASMPPCSDNKRKFTDGSLDCSDVLNMGFNRSGVYTIWPMNRVTEDTLVEVYCDMDTDGGGWTVIQRRADLEGSNALFYKNWRSYKEGFGDVKKDFWLGNDNIFALTNQMQYSARFDFKDLDSKLLYAHYDYFWIDDEYNNYTLHISDYSGDAGDSMIDDHNNQKFTTRDRDNDNSDGNCAQNNKGGWWYDACFDSNLNGEHVKGRKENLQIWGQYDSLESTEIKIRPKKFRVTHEFSNFPQY